jgi:glucose/arabinose dehydrogenase
LVDRGKGELKLRTALAATLAWVVALLAVPAAAGAFTLPGGFQDSAAISGLEAPIAVDFAQNGRVFVAEKSGIIKVFDNPDDTTPTVFADLRTQVHSFADRGIEGLVLDPNFPTNPYVYVYYVHDAPIGGTAPVWGQAGQTYDECPAPPAGPGDLSQGCVVSGRVSRLRASGDVQTGPEQVLVEDWCLQYSSHAGGGLEFGADGYLYVTGGEGASFRFWDYGQDGDPNNSWRPINPCGDPPAGVDGVQSPPTAEGGRLRSQDIRTPGDPTGLSGSLIRIDPSTGSGVPGNPGFSSSDPNVRRMLAYGLRNPFRIAIRPGSNDVFIGDVGSAYWDEIDRVSSPIDPMRNFGWPCYEGALDASGTPFSKRLDSSDALNLNMCESLYADGTASAPYFAYDQNKAVAAGENCKTAGTKPVGTVISALEFYPQGGSFPSAYGGALFFGDYARQCIWAMLPGGDGLPDRSNVQPFEGDSAFPVDLTTGPGGDLYYVDIVDGEIRRIHYTGNPANHVPVAVASAVPAGGDVPLTVALDGRDSSDPDPGDSLTYAWDLDGDGQFDDAATALTQFTYTSPGVYHPRLKVTDSGTAFDIATVTINAGSGPPTASIDSPGPSFQWAVNQPIAFSGSATDPEDGVLPSTALDWAVVLHHCTATDACHTHPLQGFQDTASGSFPAPDHDYPSYLELVLTATDSDGNTDTTSQRLDPLTTAVSFPSDPPGIDLVVGDTVQTAAFSRTMIQGATTLVSAPSTQTVNGTTYRFAGWSDGQARSHSIKAPPLSWTYAARYTPITPGTQTFTFAPEADTYGAESTPNLILGTSWVLRAAGGTTIDGEIYLRFLVDGLAGKIRSAKLRMFATDGTVDGPQAFPTTSSWDESTLTWNNRPPPAGGALADVGAVSASSWAEWDVTPAVTGAGPVSIMLAGGSSDASRYDSRESAEFTHAPQLVITTYNDAYARPRGATPMRLSLVNAYNACTASNRTHGAPLSSPSCAPPVPASAQVTFGTPDANGSGANGNGFVRYVVALGNSSTPQDEADVRIVAQISDVRRKQNLSDYTGELAVLTPVRLTDKVSGPAQNEQATISDFTIPATVSCLPTADPAVGATCNLDTTLDAIVPGAARESTRAIWELRQVQVTDGGSDADADTTPNTVFARQGVFVP